MKERFFKARPDDKPQTPKMPLMNLGQDSSCGFRAVSVGLLDHLYGHPRAHQEPLKKILEHYLQYFPTLKPTGSLLTPNEKIQQIVSKIKTTEFIHTFAYCLRQMAVDEILRQPLIYRGAFTEPHHPLTPEAMRKPDVWLNEISLAALSTALKLPIEISRIELDNELPLMNRYNSDSHHPLTNPMVMLVQTDMQFFVKVHHVEKFKAIKAHHEMTHQPQKIAQTDPSPATLQHMIKLDDEQKIMQYDQLVHQLQTMVNAGEINKEHLICLYLNQLGTTDSKQHPGIVGLEYGNQHHFDHILKSHRPSPETPRLLSHDGELVHSLIQALARQAALGLMEVEHLYDALDTPSTKAKSTHSLT